MDCGVCANSAVEEASPNLDSSVPLPDSSAIWLKLVQATTGLPSNTRSPCNCKLQGSCDSGPLPDPTPVIGGGTKVVEENTFINGVAVVSDPAQAGPL